MLYHHCLAYADDVHLLGDNIDTINKNTETLIDASKEFGLYCIYFKFHQIHIKVQVHIPQDMESIIFITKCSLYKGTSQWSQFIQTNIPIYMQINVGSIDAST
jgi:hypothetical protein